VTEQAGKPVLRQFTSKERSLAENYVNDEILNEPYGGVMVLYDPDQAKVFVIVSEEARDKNGRKIDANWLTDRGGGTTFKRAVYSGVLEQWGLEDEDGLIEYQSYMHCNNCYNDWSYYVKRGLGLPT